MKKRGRKKQIYTKKRLRMIDEIVEKQDWNGVQNPKQCKAITKVVLMLLLPTVEAVVDALLKKKASSKTGGSVDENR